MFIPNRAKEIEISLRKSDGGLPLLHWRWTDEAGNEHHRWLCNFRRYSWSWSPDEDGHKGVGFSGGPTYANGDWGMLRVFDTPEQGIALALEACLWDMATSRRGGEITQKDIDEVGLEEAKKRAYNRRETFLPTAYIDLARPALKWLLEDAIKHQSHHALTKPTHSLITMDVPVKINGFQPGELMEQEEKFVTVTQDPMAAYPTPETFGLDLGVFTSRCDKGTPAWKNIINLICHQLECDELMAEKYIEYHTRKESVAA